jgi:hypothetical protein
VQVPESALEIYQQVETFRRWTGNLDLITNMNNGQCGAVTGMGGHDAMMTMLMILLLLLRTMLPPHNASTCRAPVA